MEREASIKAREGECILKYVTWKRSRLDLLGYKERERRMELSKPGGRENRK